MFYDDYLRNFVIMAFKGKEGRPITLEQAKRWTKRYRKENDGAVRAHFYGCDQIRALLDEPGCVGIRIYYAIDDEGRRKLVLVGADAEENNLVPKEQGKDDNPYRLLNDGVDCPPSCPKPDDDEF